MPFIKIESLVIQSLNITDLNNQSLYTILIQKIKVTPTDTSVPGVGKMNKMLRVPTPACYPSAKMITQLQGSC